MIRQFVMTPVFDKQWNGMGLDDEDLRHFQNVLLKDPFVGDIIKRTGGARKVRVALKKGTGKSGGARVIYYDKTHMGKLFLLLCYPKGKQDNLTVEQKKLVREIIETL